MHTKSNIPPDDLANFSIEDLAAELSRRRACHMPVDMLSAEQALNEQHDRDRDAAFANYLQRSSESQTDEPKRCPRCGISSRVRAKGRKRKIRTLTGSHVFARHQH